MFGKSSCMIFLVKLGLKMVVVGGLSPQINRLRNECEWCGDHK